MKLNILVVIIIALLSGQVCYAGISTKYIDTDQLLELGANRYQAGGNELQRENINQGIKNYIEALAYLSAYYQRVPELASSNSSHANTIRKAIGEIEEYLADLSEGGGGVKGDDPRGITETGGKSSKRPQNIQIANQGRASRSTAVFSKPKINRYRLDWCEKRGIRCGGPAANAFCRKHEFRHATSYIKADNIGAHTPTRIITSNGICNQNHCDGFEEIVCE